MKLKKVLSVALAVAMTLSLTACGGSSSNTSSSSDGGDTSSSSESDGGSSSSEGLTVAIWDTYQEKGLTEILKDFTAETGIKATIEVTPWDQYWTMLEAGATGGSLPDVFWMHSNYASQYMEYEMLLDLTDKVADSDKIDLANYPEDISKIYANADGKQFAVPKDIDTIAFWYNKTYFDEAGISYPDDTWTWDDFTEAAAKLTTDDHYGFAGRTQNNQAGYYNAIYDYGGYIINEDKTASGWDDPKTIEAMEMYVGMVLDGSTPSAEVMLENEDSALMESGQVAMTFQGSWLISEFCNNDYIIENCDIAVLPKAEDGTRVSIYNGLGWAASGNTASSDDAWALIEYLGSKEVQEKQAQLGVTMSAYTGTSDAWIDAQPDFNLQAYLDMLNGDLVIYPHSFLTAVWDNMSKEEIGYAYDGSASVSDVCKKIADKMNETLAEEQ